MGIFELGENKPDNFSCNTENRDLDINTPYEYEKKKEWQRIP